MAILEQVYLIISNCRLNWSRITMGTTTHDITTLYPSFRNTAFQLTKRCYRRLDSGSLPFSFTTDKFSQTVQLTDLRLGVGNRIPILQTRQLPGPGPLFALAFHLMSIIVSVSNLVVEWCFFLWVNPPHRSLFL